jgi:hypothetical protein
MNLASFVKRNHRLLFYASWMAMNIIQAAATELLDDEAYYWVYSLFPDWGYFDHPPMVALFIKAGSALVPGELGVRALIVLINITTLYIIQQLVERKNDLLFYGIVLSVAIAQIGGIIAAPDLPVLFFTALFFLAYKRFAENMNALNTVLLGVVSACMLYSKYHGVLIIIFTLISNPKLFKRYQVWLAGLITLTLFMPHLYWQYTHNFPSVEYHLFERNASSYRFGYTAEYIGGQILLAGPIIGWLLLWTATRYRPTSDSERALKFTFAGLYLFFLVSTLKGRVEANWTMQAIIPLLVLSHQYLFGRPKLQKWVYNTVPVTLVLVLALRVYIVMDVDGVSWLKGDEFHQNKVWAAQLKDQSKGLPLVAINSYQKASKYWFYADVPAYSHNTPEYRRNNYNFWPISDSLLGRTVYVIGDYDSVYLNEKIRAVEFENNGGRIVDSFYSFSRVQFRNIRDIRVEDGKVSLSSKITIPAHYFPYFNKAPYNSATILLAILDENDVGTYYLCPTILSDVTATDTEMRLSFPAALPKGKHKARLGITSRMPEFPSLNSASFTIKVK